MDIWDQRGSRGQSSIEYIEDAAAIEVSANSLNEDNSNSGQLWVSGVSDGIYATVSLSGRTQLPVESSAQARIGIRGVFHNESADGGMDGQDGDIFVELLLRLRGDGRRQISFYMARNNADGNSDGYRILEDGDDSANFDLTPELDKPYELGISIDRERAVLIFTVDELIREVKLPTAAFIPARSEASVLVDHRGSSGLAAGRIHAVRTATVDENFALGVPAMGPAMPNTACFVRMLKAIL